MAVWYDRQNRCSGDALVLVNDATDDVVATNCPGSLWIATQHGRDELKVSVRPGLVVVPDILGEHILKMIRGDDKDVIEVVLRTSSPSARRTPMWSASFGPCGDSAWTGPSSSGVVTWKGRSSSTSGTTTSTSHIGASASRPVPGHTTVPLPLGKIARRSVLGLLSHDYHQLAA